MKLKMYKNEEVVTPVFPIKLEESEHDEQIDCRLNFDVCVLLERVDESQLLCPEINFLKEKSVSCCSEQTEEHGYVVPSSMNKRVCSRAKPSVKCVLVTCAKCGKSVDWDEAEMKLHGVFHLKNEMNINITNFDYNAETKQHNEETLIKVIAECFSLPSDMCTPPSFVSAKQPVRKKRNTSMLGFTPCPTLNGPIMKPANMKKSNVNLLGFSRSCATLNAPSLVNVKQPVRKYIPNLLGFRPRSTLNLPHTNLKGSHVERHLQTNSVANLDVGCSAEGGVKEPPLLSTLGFRPHATLNAPVTKIQATYLPTTSVVNLDAGCLTEGDVKESPLPTLSSFRPHAILNAPVVTNQEASPVEQNLPTTSVAANIDDLGCSAGQGVNHVPLSVILPDIKTRIAVCCNKCKNFVNNSVTSLKLHCMDHLMSERNIFPYYCRLCSATSMTLSGMQSHLQSVHNDPTASRVNYKTYASADEYQVELVKLATECFFPSQQRNKIYDVLRNGSTVLVVKEAQKCRKTIQCAKCLTQIVGDANSQRYHVLHHLQRETEFQWIYKCLICTNFTTMQRLVWEQHCNYLHGGVLKLIKGVHYVDNESVTTLPIQQLERDCFENQLPLEPHKNSAKCVNSATAILPERDGVKLIPPNNHIECDEVAAEKIVIKSEEDL